MSTLSFVSAAQSKELANWFERAKSFAESGDTDAAIEAYRQGYLLALPMAYESRIGKSPDGLHPLQMIAELYLNGTFCEDGAYVIRCAILYREEEFDCTFMLGNMGDTARTFRLLLCEDHTEEVWEGLAALESGVRDEMQNGPLWLREYFPAGRKAVLA